MKKVDFDLKVKLNGKRIYPTKSAKYLGIKIGERLTWNEQINDIAIKLNRANAMLYKVAYSYYRRKPLESLVLNVEMLIQPFFSTGMKLR